jgi:hypothetical protein
VANHVSFLEGKYTGVIEGEDSFTSSPQGNLYEWEVGYTIYRGVYRRGQPVILHRGVNKMGRTP